MQKIIPCFYLTSILLLTASNQTFAQAAGGLKGMINFIWWTLSLIAFLCGIIGFFKGLLKNTYLIDSSYKSERVEGYINVAVSVGAWIAIPMIMIGLIMISNLLLSQVSF